MIKQVLIQMPGGSLRGSLACALRAHVLCSKMLFDLASIANVSQKCSQKMKKGQRAGGLGDFSHDEVPRKCWHAHTALWLYGFMALYFMVL